VVNNAHERAHGGREGVLPPTLAEATEHQPAARAALAAALRVPSHAYLFAGPRGAGKAAAARAFAAELVAADAPDPEAARRRALADPPAHPDVTWVAPVGTQHLVEEIRTRVIAASAYRPFEGARRVFVVAAAEAMAEESQNALLKTLEEPPPFAHLLLLTSQPAGLLETVRSRCQPVRFVALPPEAVAAALAEVGAGESEPERTAAARLAGGDRDRALSLLRPPGSELRAAAARLVGSARTGELGGAPWLDLVELAERAGADAADALRARLAEADEPEPRRGSAREAEEAIRRVSRRARTDALDLGLALVCAWLRDLAAVGWGADDLVLNSDRVGELSAAAEGLDPRAPRRAAEVAMDVRRRLTVNVGEELALEALAFRLESLLAHA
jgi:DNA polymerase III subunit delta'